MQKELISMLNIPKFALSRIVDGFLILLPFLLTYLMMGQLFDAMLALAAPIADLLPKGPLTSRMVTSIAGRRTVSDSLFAGGSGHADPHGQAFWKMDRGDVPEPYASLCDSSKSGQKCIGPGCTEPASTRAHQDRSRNRNFRFHCRRAHRRQVHCFHASGAHSRGGHPSDRQPRKNSKIGSAHERCSRRNSQLGRRDRSLAENKKQPLPVTLQPAFVAGCQLQIYAKP